MDTILDFLPYVAVAYIFYNIGSHVRAFQIMQNLAKRPDDFIEMINKIKDINESIEVGMPEDAIEVKTEQVNDLIFAYNKTTGEFLAQAQNLHQVMLAAAERFPGKKFWHPELKQDSQTA
jgi:hypothetical protein